MENSVYMESVAGAPTVAKELHLPLGTSRNALQRLQGRRPQAVKVTYPIPENLHHNRLVNEVMRRRYQFRWEHVEYEARKIERGTWTEPVHTPLMPRDDYGNRILKLDLRALAREKNARAREDALFVPSRTLRVHAPIDERDLYGASSLADRIRIVPA